MAIRFAENIKTGAAPVCALGVWLGCGGGDDVYGEGVVSVAERPRPRRPPHGAGPELIDSSRPSGHNEERPISRGHNRADQLAPSELICIQSDSEK